MKHNVKLANLAAILSVSTVLLLSVFIPVGSASAASNHQTSGKFVNSGSIPHGAKLIVNITYKVTNDEDSGNLGYWALDSYNKHVQIWQDPSDPNLFYVIARYDGSWNTFSGASSPGYGKPESRDAAGTFQGGYVATFSGTFAAAMKTKGYIGSFDFGGTKSDILLGTYGSGQAGSTTPFDYIGSYFAGAANFNYINWGWTYHYKNQTWNNYSSGTSGDIVA